MSRERITLIVFIFLIVVALFVYRDLFFGNKGPVGSSTSSEMESTTYKVASLNLDIMEQKTPSFDADGRNLFTYGLQPPSIASIIRNMELKEQQEREAREKALEREEKVAANRAEEKKPPKTVGPVVPPVFYDFIGYIGPETGKIAIFKERDKKNIKVGKVGDVFDNYVVKEIGYESVLLGFKNSDAEKRIPLSTGD